MLNTIDNDKSIEEENLSLLETTLQKHVDLSIIIKEIYEKGITTENDFLKEFKKVASVLNDIYYYIEDKFPKSANTNNLTPRFKDTRLINI